LALDADEAEALPVMTLPYGCLTMRKQHGVELAHPLSVRFGARSCVLKAGWRAPPLRGCRRLQSALDKIAAQMNQRIREEVMSTKGQAWKKYEDVAIYLLNEFSDRFGLDRVEGKQHVLGDSGATWEIDGKAVKRSRDGFLIVECRRSTKSRQSQEKVGALAYRVRDTGARGGIIVSPFDLQKGAQIVAQAESISRVTLTPSSTTQDYLMEFLNEAFVALGASDTATIADSVVSIVKTSADGTTQIFRP
jgi:hypothetical protein